MKRFWFILVNCGAIVLSAGLGCRNEREANVTVLEPQKTIIVRAENTAQPPLPAQPSGEQPNAPTIIPQPGDSVGNAKPEITGATANNRQIVLGGRFRATVPAHWVAKPPAISLIEHEFAVPSTIEGEPDGRVTFSSARGGVQANIERWANQFRFAAGQDLRQAVKHEKTSILGENLHLVDISGTYLETFGPRMEKAVEREGYRMLGAIIECQDGFLYFIKFYGPQATVKENELAFRAMIESLQAVGPQ
ncbi:MAG TPA: hypothetical protein PLD05_13440 [Thermogutta sp.]|nr:hypothetical protein [Thermogutta sp.]